MRKTIFYKRALILFLTVQSVSNLMAQTISGQIVDSKHTPMGYVSIVGEALTDSTHVISSAYSGDDGRFVLDCSSCKDAKLRFKTSFVGFKPFQMDISTNYVFEKPIVLTENVIGLNEVVVSAYKRAITLEDGKIGIDVGRLTLGNTENALDVLKRTPGVVVVHDDIKVQGSAPLVVIDGVKQRVPLNTLINYLKSLPASSLDKLYIKSAATAENRLSGEDATIEIRTKKKNKNGYNISNTSHGTLLRGDAYKWGDYMDLRGRYGNVSGSATMGYAQSAYVSHTEVSDPDALLHKQLNQKNNGDKDAYFGVLNLTWAPKVLKGSLNYFASYYVDDSHRKHTEKYQNNDLLEQDTHRAISDWTDLLSTNIEYLSADTLTHQFKISYGLLTGTDDYNQHAHNSLGDLRTTDKDMGGHRHIVEAEYSLNLPKFVYRIGSQSYFSKMHENVRSKINENVNSKDESDFDVWETITGIYTSGRYTFRPNLSMYVGGRLEYTHYKYMISQSVSKDIDWNFAPYLSLDWKVSTNYSASLYLTMKNERPGYFSMLPGRTYSNDDEYGIGNPFLKSSMQYEIEMKNLLFKYAVIELGARLENNQFGTTYHLDDDGLRYTQPMNYADLLYLYGDISVPFSFCQGKVKGSLSLYLRNLSYHHVLDDVKSSAFDLNSDWYARGNLYAAYQPTDNFGIYINPSFHSQYNTLQVRKKGYMIMDMGMQYTLPRNKQWSFALSVENLFNQLKEESVYNYGGHHVTNTISPNTQCLRFSLTYTISHAAKHIRIHKNENDASRFMK